MSTNAIVRFALEQANAANHARKNHEEGVGKLTELQRRTLKLWRGDANSHKVNGLESRARFRNRGE